MDANIDLKKRKFLTVTTSVVGFVGISAASIPFISYLTPNAKTKASGAPVEVNISKLEQGQLLRVLWRKKPIWILRRYKKSLQSLKTYTDQLRDPLSNDSKQPEYAKNYYRSKKPDIAIMIGICTHLGCSPVL